MLSLCHASDERLASVETALETIRETVLAMSSSLAEFRLWISENLETEPEPETEQETETEEPEEETVTEPEPVTITEFTQPPLPGNQSEAPDGQRDTPQSEPEPDHPQAYAVVSFL